MNEDDFAKQLSSVLSPHHMVELDDPITIYRYDTRTEITWSGASSWDQGVSDAIMVRWPDIKASYDSEGGCDSCGYGCRVTVDISIPYSDLERRVTIAHAQLMADEEAIRHHMSLLTPEQSVALDELLQTIGGKLAVLQAPAPHSHCDDGLVGLYDETYRFYFWNKTTLKWDQQ